MDVKVCDMCREVITDPYEAEMICFYINEEPRCSSAANPLSNVFIKKKVETPKIQVDLCGECWNKLKDIARAEAELKRKEEG